MRRALPLILPLVLAGCVVPVPLYVGTVGPGFDGGGATPAARDTCGAGELAVFTGQPVSELREYGLPAGARVIRPGQAVTMDFNPSRLNVELDARDRVAKLTCG